MKSNMFARIPSSEFVVISALLVVCAPAMELSAQESEFSPANSGFFNGFADLTLAPDDIPAGNETITVACQGMVETDGAMADYLCLPNE